ncbi:hypothetical protein EDD22DRAFT_908131 [Suillus occidentalis]|nr:hypothetical protein EDD22DRAFT_908131 [Suillus occidentalis]
MTRLDHPERHRILQNLSSVLCSRFTQTQKNEDVEEAITLNQKALASLPSLHPDRNSSWRWPICLVSECNATFLICHLL